MRLTYVFIYCFLLVCTIQTVSGQGASANICDNPTLFHIDRDGDGLGDLEYTDSNVFTNLCTKIFF